MYIIGFKLRAFGPSIPLNKHMLEIMLDALTKMNVAILRTSPQIPNLYESGVKYRRESIGQEDWCDIPEIIRLGFADCEDLACWRAAELQVRFGEPRARAIVRGPRKLPGGVMMYHIQTLRPDARQKKDMLEDPSKRLGMGTKRDRTPAAYRIRRHDG
jgi:hypothetical protein